jgi:hypothetical protein
VRSVIARSTVYLGAALALFSGCVPIRAEQTAQDQAERAEPEEHSGIEQQLFAELIDHNQTRSEAMLAYSATRTYRVSNPNGKVHAEVEGRMEFQAPDTKRFVVSSEHGSAIVRRLALHPLIASN